MMITRCEDPNFKDYAMYGGAGVRVCDRWRADFAAFVADMGEPPSPVHSLDRHPDQTGNYEPGNVRWATPKEQARNRKSNRMLTAFGRTLSMAEWAERGGIDPRVIHLRLKRGWSVERSVSAAIVIDASMEAARRDTEVAA